MSRALSPWLLGPTRHLPLPPSTQASQHHHGDNHHTQASSCCPDVLSTTDWSWHPANLQVWHTEGNFIMMTLQGGLPEPLLPNRSTVSNGGGLSHGQAARQANIHTNFLNMCHVQPEVVGMPAWATTARLSQKEKKSLSRCLFQEAPSSAPDWPLCLALLRKPPTRTVPVPKGWNAARLCPGISGALR